MIRKHLLDLIKSRKASFVIFGICEGYVIKCGEIIVVIGPVSERDHGHIFSFIDPVIDFFCFIICDVGDHK